MAKSTRLVMVLVVLVLSMIAGLSTATAATATAPGTFTILLSENYDPKYLLGDTPVFKEWERLANVRITYQTAPGGDPINTIIQTRLASGIDLPDIMAASVITDSNAINLAKQGMLVDLTNLIPKYPSIQKAFYTTYPTVAKIFKSPQDGHIYWLPSYIYGSPMEGRMLSVRQDWMAAAGIKDVPTTTDAFYQYMKAVQAADPNGNKKKDEIWLWDSFNGASYMAGAWGVNLRDDERSFQPLANGKIVASYVTDEAKAYFQYIAKFYAEGLVDQDPFNMSPEAYNNKLATNTVAAGFGPGYMAARDTQALRE
jgi:putative aldouronate transport system substrate-binding protein